MKSLLYCLILFNSVQLFSQDESLLSQLYSNKGIQMIETGSISTQMGEYSPFYDVNHNELYFMRRTPGLFDYTIYIAKLTKEGWSKPKVVSFSGTYRDAAPYISPDGNTLFFDSKRPSQEVVKNSINVWYSKRKGNQWSEPKLVKAASVNSKNESPEGSDEFGPAVDGYGNLYFYSFRNPYRGGAHYITYPPKYNEVNRDQDLPDPSYKTFVSYLYISQNGKFALLEGKDRNGSKTDIFYSCKDSNGNWKEPKRVPLINTSFGEGVPSMTANGQFMFFASDRKSEDKRVSNANIYVVETKNLFGKCYNKLKESY